MEGKVLKTINFEVTITSSLMFLNQYAEIAKFTRRDKNFARYFLELALIDYSMIKYIPSNLACSAVYLV